MSNSIVPDSAGRGKSNHEDGERHLVNNSRVLAGWVQDTADGLEALRAWLDQLQEWRRQSVTMARFQGATRGLKTEGLEEWAIAHGLESLQAAVVIQKPHHIEQAIKQTQKTMRALEVWHASLRSWQHVESIPAADFEGMAALIRHEQLGSWAELGITELRAAVVAPPKGDNEP